MVPSLNLMTRKQPNVLNKFFASVFTNENNDNVPILPDRNNDNFICDLVLTKEAVLGKLENLNPNKAMGPDKIPPIILKELSGELCFPLTVIYNKSLSERKLPSDWKSAQITALFKKGNELEPGNYRPVSLTCVSCKILESFVTDQVVDYMENNGFFSKCQHGFRRHRSCVTQLLEVLNNLTEWIENSENIDIIYLDFCKAFDSVPHKRLLNKLKAYGISGNLLDWIADFLSDRKQRVKVNNSVSSEKKVTSCIPQGSILGPVLFIIFINDFPENVQSTCKVFADDTKIYNVTKNHDIIQNDINALFEWSRTWQLNFNLAKCCVLHIGNKNECYEYYMEDGKKIECTTEEKDVGVTFSTDLKFDIHINKICNKANQLAGLMRRCF